MFVLLCSAAGWDHVVKALLELGLLLIDTFAPRAAGAATRATSHGATAAHRATALGAEIITLLFKVSRLTLNTSACVVHEHNNQR